MPPKRQRLVNPKNRIKVPRLKIDPKSMVVRRRLKRRFVDDAQAVSDVVRRAKKSERGIKRLKIIGTPHTKTNYVFVFKKK